MKKLKIQILLILLALVGNTTFGQTNMNEELVVELTNLNGILDNHTTIDNRLLEQLKDDLPEISLAFWQSKEKALDEKYDSNVKDSIIDIYSLTMSEKELKLSINELKTNPNPQLPDTYYIAFEKVMELAHNLSGEISKNIDSEIMSKQLLNIQLDTSDCTLFNEGEYTNILADGTVIQIHKTKEVQYSRISDNFIRFEIHHINQCDYSLKLVETNFAHLAEDIGNIIEIHPYYIDDQMMKYRSIMLDGTDFVAYGILNKKK